MSEKMYALLLRLFPAQFREEYGAEALQLFRDRARDEKGFVRGVRLWLDLLTDLAFSLPREHWYSGRVEAAGAGILYGAGGVPAFYFIEDQLPRKEALACGLVVTMFAGSALAMAAGQATKRPSFEGGTLNFSRTIAYGRPGGRRSLRSKDGNTVQAIGEPIGSMGSGPGNSSDLPQTENVSSDPANFVVIPSRELDQEERQRVIDAVIANLKGHYPYPEVARRMANELVAHQKSGQYEALDGWSFAEMLTRQMRNTSHDAHLELVYSEKTLPPQPHEPTAAETASMRELLRKADCEILKVETLRHNIGYLKLNWFADVSACGDKMKEAMASVNHASAIIFDLRDNRGGDPEMVALVAAYLFDRPEYWYSPRENTTRASWTHSPVPGNLLADKPVYILTSEQTFSGAEQFCYDLKMLKRATLVGDTTGGGAHAGVWHRIDEHFGVGVPEVKPINPFSDADWEGRGVEPDIRVKPADALEMAVRAAETKLRKD
jgi:hypothetical protein